ncbi:MAG: hypothetical protein KF842_08735 [Caulobacter sp.]|nr:hypothetical protein [Caulobacter sp.]
MPKIATVLASLSITLAATPAFAAREDQWVAREEMGDGGAGPVALFLTWDYSKVLFRATCDKGELVLDYFGDGEVALIEGIPIRIYGQSIVTLPTQLVDGRLEGRVKVTEAVLQALAVPHEMQIDASNAMGEPWYVGQAKPLLALARRCS